MVANSDLIILGEVRDEQGKETLFAAEVLKGKLGNDVSFQIGGQIAPTFGSLKNVAGAGGKVLLFYQKRFGSQCWLMTVSASGEYAAIVEELRRNSSSR